MQKRRCGVLLALSSLPSAGPVGTMGQGARDFIDYLAEAGVGCWQMLPHGPLAFGYSPYQSPSSCAGSPYYIDMETLVEYGLLTEEDIADFRAQDEGRAAYEALEQGQEALLRAAYARGGQSRRAETEDFLAGHRAWAEDYALFCALKKRFGGLPWYMWEEDIRLRRPEAMARWQAELAAETDYYIFVQYLFFMQWGAMKRYANEKGVELIGDMPIYAAYDSADVWAQPRLFCLNDDLSLAGMAGVPPDYFSPDGQLWGNPLYRWQAHREEGYGWWRRRMHTLGELFDRVRIDHFRGLASYWAVPAGEQTARGGHWEDGPGMELISAMREECPDLGLIAEDLGFLGEDVHALLEESGLPGMRILEFAFDSRDFTAYQPHMYDKNCVVYTGTHDNDTLAGWLSAAPEATRRYIDEYFALAPGDDPAEALMRGAAASVAELCVLPMQDILGLGSAARMNTPGTVGGENWRWRMTAADLAAARADARLASWNRLYGRFFTSE